MTSCVKVFLVHGKADRQARFSASESAREALEGAGYDLTFRSFDGGHTVPPDELGQVAEWMESVFSR